MSINDLDGKIKELRELRRMADELAAEIETITDSIKSEMTARSVDELTGTDWKATWKEVVTSRLALRLSKGPFLIWRRNSPSRQESSVSALHKRSSTIPAGQAKG